MRRIEFKEHQPPVPAANVAAVEQGLAELGHRLPDSYREFLAMHDGGPPVQDRFVFREREGGRQRDRIAYFLGVAPSPDGDLLETAQALHGRAPSGLLPIAGDPYGNFLLLDTRDTEDGAVWFWDHERETDHPHESDLSHVASHFTTFLDGLGETPRRTVDTSQSTGLKRRRKLFGRR
jgi:SMI1 / KNR4 family (SUKH-1)